MSVDAHLARCPDCRAELAELAELPALLGRRSEQGAAGGIDEELPPNLLPQLLSRVGAERWRHRRGTLVAIGAAVLVAVAGAGFAATQVVGPPEHRPGRLGERCRGDDLSQLAGSTRWHSISLRSAGVPSGQWCRLIAVDDTGRQQVLSTVSRR